MRKILFAALAAILSVAPLAAAAQDVPSYAQPGGDDQQLRGRVTAFDGAYRLTVRDDKGYIDNVQLHQGTIINPTGLTLAPGMIVSVLGYNAGPYFAANEIDTPYTFYTGIPYYAGHPWFYYGPAISLGFFFGSPGWWHGGFFVGPYTYYGHARVYGSVRITNFYHDGAFQGRSYVVPAERGGYAPRGQASVGRRGGGPR